MLRWTHKPKIFVYSDIQVASNWLSYLVEMKWKILMSCHVIFFKKCQTFHRNAALTFANKKKPKWGPRLKFRCQLAFNPTAYMPHSECIKNAPSLKFSFLFWLCVTKALDLYWPLSKTTPPPPYRKFAIQSLVAAAAADLTFRFHRYPKLKRGKREKKISALTSSKKLTSKNTISDDAPKISPLRTRLQIPTYHAKINIRISILALNKHHLANYVYSFFTGVSLFQGPGLEELKVSFFENLQLL